MWKLCRIYNFLYLLKSSSLFLSLIFLFSESTQSLEYFFGTKIFKIIQNLIFDDLHLNDIGSPCALSGKMLLVRIVENNKTDAYFRAG